MALRVLDGRRIRSGGRCSGAANAAARPLVTGAVGLFLFCGSALAQGNLTAKPDPQAIDTGSCEESRATFGGAARLRIRTPEGTRMCSGVLISDTAVLTAAHCFDQDTDSIPINIHVQTQNSTITPCITISSGDNQCGDRLFRVRQHPDWNGNGAANDIAVAHIRSNNLRYRDRAIPSSDIARLYADVWQKSRRQVRTGYGACRNDGFGSGTYREAAVRIQDFFDLHYRDRAQINNRGCRGDSGGPAYLQAGSERRPIVVGLHSSSVKWGRSECAGVALRQRWVKISPKVAWISSTLSALSGRGCRAPFTNVDGVDYRICFD